jgi:glycosyltransferase involved in cell wall biosynthesis
MTEDSKYTLVITATYNRAHLLPAAIESVLAQDYPYKKMIIIDDGSADNTEDICRRYIIAHPQTISYYRKENGGCASARNFGLDLMDDTFGYVCFLDSDDRMLPGKLSREITLLQSTPDADFVYTDTVIYNENTKKEKISRAAAADNPEKLAICHYLTNRITCGATLYRASVVKEKRFDNSMKYNEDSDFLQELCIECKGVYSSLPGYWARDHQGSKSKNMVEIHKAVLATNNRIINLYPDFYRKYESSINRRNRKVGRMHFVALMAEQRYNEAANYIKNPVYQRSCYYFFVFLNTLKPYIKKLLRR